MPFIEPVHVLLHNRRSDPELVSLLREQAPTACRQEAWRGDREPRREASGVCYRHGGEENRPGHIPGAIQALRLLYQIRRWLSHPCLWPGQNHLDVVDGSSSPACVHLLQFHSVLVFWAVAGLNSQYALLFRRVQFVHLYSRTVALLNPSSLKASEYLPYMYMHMFSPWRSHIQMAMTSTCIMCKSGLFKVQIYS